MGRALALALLGAIGAGLAAPACSSNAGGSPDAGRETKPMPCGAAAEGAMVVVPGSYCPSFECSGGYAYAVCVGGFFSECNCGGACVLMDGGPCDFPDGSAAPASEGGSDAADAGMVESTDSSAVDAFEECGSGDAGGGG